jgi:TonB family protein
MMVGGRDAWELVRGIIQVQTVVGLPTAVTDPGVATEEPPSVHPGRQQVVGLGDEDRDAEVVVDPPPVLLKQVDPKYPPAARRAGIEGLVVVTYALDAGGRPTDLRVTKSVRLLDDAVLDALRQWEYTRPAKGQTPPRYRFNAEFVLDKPSAFAATGTDAMR